MGYLPNNIEKSRSAPDMYVGFSSLGIFHIHKIGHGWRAISGMYVFSKKTLQEISEHIIFLEILMAKE